MVAYSFAHRDGFTGWLPGWQYTWAEIRAEMVPDLEALAERGVRPTEATSPEAP